MKDKICQLNPSRKGIVFMYLSIEEREFLEQAPKESIKFLNHDGAWHMIGECENLNQNPAIAYWTDWKSDQQPQNLPANCIAFFVNWKNAEPDINFPDDAVEGDGWLTIHGTHCFCGWMMPNGLVTALPVQLDGIKAQWAIFRKIL